MTKDTIQRCSDLKNDATNKLASPKKLFETLLCFCVPRVTWLQERLVFDAWKSETLLHSQSRNIGSPCASFTYVT